FFQAEDGIRDFHVTGVQTCALPIWMLAAAVNLTHLAAENLTPEQFATAGSCRWRRPGHRSTCCASHTLREARCTDGRSECCSGKIGRASCRERVWVSVGAVSRKKRR